MAGFRGKKAIELLRSAEALALVTKAAQQVQAKAGEGYAMGSSVGRNRARAYVITASNTARRDNAENNTLIKALEAGRG